MTKVETVYRSILAKISGMPVDYLQLVDHYLEQLYQRMEAEKQENRQKILTFAGAWNDMSDSDFEEYLKAAKDTGDNIFQDRNIDL